MGGRDGGESAAWGECKKRAWKSGMFLPPCSLPLFERSAYPFSSYSPSTPSFLASALPSASSSSRLVSASRPTQRIRQSSRASAMSGEFLSRFLRRDFLPNVITGGGRGRGLYRAKSGLIAKRMARKGRKIESSGKGLVEITSLERRRKSCSEKPVPMNIYQRRSLLYAFACILC